MKIFLTYSVDWQCFHTLSSHSRHVFCVTQQTCLLCHTADMSAVSHSRHVCCDTQQTCLLCHTADMSAASRNRHVCCATQQTCLLRHTAEMSAASGPMPQCQLLWRSGSLMAIPCRGETAALFFFAFRPTNEKLPYIRRLQRILGVYKFLFVSNRLLPSPAGRRSTPLFPSQPAQYQL